MDDRNELMELIAELPESEIPHVINLLKKTIKNHYENKITPGPTEGLSSLDTFMATIVHSLTNTMYDLSLDAKRKEEKVMANRLETYRKKVSEGWDIYRKSKEKGR